jgi:hypothetical protein
MTGSKGSKSKLKNRKKLLQGHSEELQNQKGGKNEKTLQRMPERANHGIVF